MEVPIESVDELADHTAIEYGTMHGGSTITFFQVRAYTRHHFKKKLVVPVKQTYVGAVSLQSLL